MPVILFTSTNCEKAQKTRRVLPFGCASKIPRSGALVGVFKLHKTLYAPTWLRISSTTLTSGRVASITMPLLGMSSFVACKRRMSSRSLLLLPQSSSGRLSSRSLSVSTSTSKTNTLSKTSMNSSKLREPPQKKVTSSS
jgi:hypothetical protein